VASVINYYGGSVEMHQLHENSGATENDVSLFGLCKAAESAGFAAKGFKANIDAIKGLSDPVILHVSKDSGGEDFVVVYGWHKDRFVVGDPQWGIIEYRDDELEVIWKSNSLIAMEPGDSIQTTAEKRKLKSNWIIKVLENYKKVLLTIGIFAIANAAVFAILLSFFFETVDSVSDSRILVNRSVIFFLLLLVFIVLLHFKNVFVLQGKKNFIVDLTARLTESIFEPNSFKDTLSLTNIKTFEKPVEVLGKFVFNVAAALPSYTIIFIVSLVFISVLSIWAGIVVVLQLLFSLLIAFFIQKRIEQLNITEHEDFKEKEKTFRYNNRTIKNIKLVNGEKRFVSQSIDYLKALLETRLSIALLKKQNYNWLFLIFGAVTLILVNIVFVPEADGWQNLWFALTGWLIINFLSVFKLTKMIADFNEAQTSFKIIYNVIGNRSVHKDDELHKVQKSEVTRFEKLSVKNLEFAFPGQAPIFQNVSLVAKIGDITVVNGATGSGKSTLISILGRIVPFQIGEIRINGNSWDQISDSNWKANTSVVLNPVQLYEGSVIENIGISDNSFDPKQIIAFCKKTGFDEFIKKFPNGYSTASDRLSAGQEQLVAFAMAIYRNPKLLLLDVPFLFMDEEMAGFSMKLLHKLKNRMIIIIFNASNKVKSKADKFFVYKMGNYNY
jgi:ATP-binding cassette subfamily B protein